MSFRYLTSSMQGSCRIGLNVCIRTEAAVLQHELHTTVILPACLFNLCIGHPGAALLLGSAGVITSEGYWYRPQRGCCWSDGRAVLACRLTLELLQVSIGNGGQHRHGPRFGCSTFG